GRARTRRIRAAMAEPAHPGPERGPPLGPLRPGTAGARHRDSLTPGRGPAGAASHSPTSSEGEESMRKTRLASLWRALPGIGIAAVAVFAAFAVATGGGAPGPVYAGSDDDSMAGMDMGAMQGANYWQDVSGGGFQSDGVTRTYYISADQVNSNYAPQGTNEITGEPFDDVADT